MCFSNSYLKLWELNTKTGNFIEGKSLIVLRAQQNESIFVDYQWIMRKGVPYLVVLLSNNTVRYIEMDLTKDQHKDPIDLKIDYKTIDIKLIHPEKNVAKDVDDTFGFDNVGGPGKSDYEILNQDEAKEPNFHISTTVPNREGKASKEVIATAMACNNEGFIVASSEGILSFFKHPDPNKHRDKKFHAYHMHTYQIAGVMKEKIVSVFVDSSKFKMSSLILQHNITVALRHLEAKVVLLADGPDQSRGGHQTREVFPCRLPQLPN